MPKSKLLFLFLVAILPFSGVACVERINVGDKFKRVQEFALRLLEQKGAAFIANLSEVEKRAIEEWLSKNKLNEYGDPVDTVYAGGTPLFDGTTGVSTDRYEHLFNKFPELKDIVKNAITEKGVEKK